MTTVRATTTTVTGAAMMATGVLVVFIGLTVGTAVEERFKKEANTLYSHASVSIHLHIILYTIKIKFLGFKSSCYRLFVKCCRYVLLSLLHL